MSTILNMHSVDQLATIVDDVERDGYSVFDDFLAPQELREVNAFVRDHQRAGHLVEAATGKRREQDASVRGDSILWLDEDDVPPPAATCLDTIHALRTECNRRLFLNVSDVECHVAVYPPGAGYDRHLDQFANGDLRRRLSFVVYLNNGWDATDGGALRLYLDDQLPSDHVDVAPIGGRLVLFESSRFWHEVLPASRERLSITGWMRTRS